MGQHFGRRATLTTGNADAICDLAQASHPSCRRTGGHGVSGRETLSPQPGETVLSASGELLGYLLLENGIFLFGLLLLEAMPFLVEVGVLLDLFTGIFVMGIIIHHISREFASISTEHLTELKE